MWNGHRRDRVPYVEKMMEIPEKLIPPELEGKWFLMEGSSHPTGPQPGRFQGPWDTEQEGRQFARENSGAMYRMLHKGSKLNEVWTTWRTFLLEMEESARNAMASGW